MPKEKKEKEDDEGREETPRYELVIQLPRILHEPLVREDGVVLSEGDEVIHPKYGKGEIIRLACYDDVGPAVYVMFESGDDKILGASFVQKLEKS